MLLKAFDDESLLLEQLEVLLAFLALVPHKLHLLLQIAREGTTWFLSISTGSRPTLGSGRIPAQRCSDRRAKVCLSSRLAQTGAVTSNATIPALSILARVGAASLSRVLGALGSLPICLFTRWECYTLSSKLVVGFDVDRFTVIRGVFRECLRPPPQAIEQQDEVLSRMICISLISGKNVRSPMPQITRVAHLHVFGVVPTMNSKSIHHLLPEVNYVLFVCLGLHQAPIEQHERA